MGTVKSEVSSEQVRVHTIGTTMTSSLIGLDFTGLDETEEGTHVVLVDGVDGELFLTGVS